MKRSIILMMMLGICLGLSVSCVLAQAESGSTTELYTDMIEFPSISLKICEADGRRYKVKVEGDKAKVLSDPNEDFGGSVLCFDGSKYRSLSAYVEYEFGVKQYFYDAQPAKLLSFRIETILGEIYIEDDSILNPQTNDDIDGIQTIYQQLGFRGREDFEAEFESSNFSSFGEMSYSMQKAFYADSLKKDRKRLEECCPEYISQAEAFLNRNRAEFREMKDLNLELVRTKTLITLTGETRDGVKFKYFIEDKLQD